MTQLQVVTDGFVQGVEHLGQSTKTAAKDQAAFLCAGSPEQTGPERKAYRVSGKETEQVSVNLSPLLHAGPNSDDAT